MVAIDEITLDELYQQLLQIKTDMMLENKQLEKLSEAAQLKLQEKKQEIRALRESRQSEFLEWANSIFQWVRDLTRSAKGSKLLSILAEVAIFRGYYHDCKPKEEKEYEAWLTCDSNGVLRYREFYKGIMGQSKVLRSAVQMVDRLHPDYILAALDAITTGWVWKELERAIN